MDKFKSSGINKTMDKDDFNIKPAAFWAISGVLPSEDFHFIKRSSANNSTENLRSSKNTWERTNIVTPFNIGFSKKSDALIHSNAPLFTSSVSIHRLMRTFVFTGQLFGLLPVVGILGPTPQHLRFRWFSWRLIYSLLSALAATIIAGLCFRRICKMGFSFQITSSLVFFLTATLTTGAFLRLAKRWPKLVRGVSRYEGPSFDISRHRRLTRSCHCIELWILFLAGVEHTLSTLAGFSLGKQCSPHLRYDSAYFHQAWPQVFNATTYALWKGIVCEVINLQSTFNWNFMDLFIIIISCYLTDRFREINDRIKIVQNEMLPKSFWASIRQDFCNLVETVKSVDSAISEIILLSFANNLYFICLQLYNSIKPIRGLIHLSYFAFSFVFLVGRTLAVSLYASRVNSTSKELIHQLNCVPSTAYCTEVRRFMQQVRYDNVAVTGMGLFNITRGLVLTVAGTILTYELVLLQFNNGRIATSFDECNFQKD